MLILASNSPRRRELLKIAGFEFRTVPAEAEEITPPLKPETAAVETAKAKALEVAAKYPGDAVLAADTIVVLGNEIMGKPKDETGAFHMLRVLSGVGHTVITGVFVIRGDVCRSFFEKTSVEFYELSDEEIKAYIRTGEPFDKAGAYGVQEKGALLVKRIEGDYFNVMGLPIAKTARVLKEFGVSAKWNNQ